MNEAEGAKALLEKIAANDAWVIAIGLGVIVGLVVAQLVEENGLVVLAVTLVVLLAVFALLGVLIDSDILFQFLLLVGYLGIAAGVALAAMIATKHFK